MIFTQAIPVTPAGYSAPEHEVLFFKASLPQGTYRLRIGAHSLYRLRVNGQVTGYGPARAAEGHAYIDTYCLTLTKEHNLLEVELLQENRPSYFIPAGPLFFIAEVQADDGTVVLATGTGHNIVCRRHPWRVWNGFCHSGQRFSMECYDYTLPGDTPELPLEAAAVSPIFALRRAPMPELGTIIPAEFTGLSPLGRLPLPHHEPTLPHYEPNYVPDDQCSHWRFQGVQTGFLQFHFKANQSCHFHIVYGEFLPDEGPLNHNVWWGNSIIPIQMTAGQELEWESLDVHTLQFCTVIYPKETLEVSNFSLREYAFPRQLISNPLPENPLAIAATETFRQCTLDLFMDCPDRERTAWLCDSFFIARTSFILTGNTSMEEIFLDNFMLAPQNPNLPKGMFPMCYPADTDNFIPQWALWLILEIEEYLTLRKGKINYPKLYQQRLLLFLDCMKTYQNADGLLENLPGWNFIDCSRASEFTDGINYPTNLLFAQALDCFAKWYQSPDLAAQASAIRHRIHDQGIADGRLLDSNQTTATSEAAQYYALLFGNGFFPEISLDEAPNTHLPCGLLMAKMMRFELLYQAGRIQQLNQELEQNFMPIIRLTGTLWEKLLGAVPWYEQTSCCHNFATAIIHWMQ